MRLIAPASHYPTRCPPDMGVSNTAIRALFLITVVGLLGGCFGGSGACEKTEPYQTSRSGGDLKVPDGLSVPDGGGAMRVPEISPEVQVRGPCADVPPKVEVVAREPETPPVDETLPDSTLPRDTPQRTAAPSNLPPIVIPSITGIADVDVTATLQAWLEAWRRGDVETYLSFYADDFVPPVDGESRAEWEEKRVLLLGDTGNADIRYDLMTVTETDEGARARFVQEFHEKDGQIHAVVKILELVPRQFRWLIRSEEVEAVL